ncbi:MAG TPA: hypothetical protein HPP76_02515 [Desulfuromonadales bacterium]|nr:hypothetical protein [Desulfuromonadales bacterium]
MHIISMLSMYQIDVGTVSFPAGSAMGMSKVMATTFGIMLRMQIYRHLRAAILIRLQL